MACNASDEDHGVGCIEDGGGGFDDRFDMLLWPPPSQVLIVWP
jgi:hypothetical protein